MQIKLLQPLNLQSIAHYDYDVRVVLREQQDLTTFISVCVSLCLWPLSAQSLIQRMINQLFFLMGTRCLWLESSVVYYF